jgi:hypothetical protein
MPVQSTMSQIVPKTYHHVELASQHDRQTSCPKTFHHVVLVSQYPRWTFSDFRSRRRDGSSASRCPRWTFCHNHHRHIGLVSRYSRSTFCHSHCHRVGLFSRCPRWTSCPIHYRGGRSASQCRLGHHPHLDCRFHGACSYILLGCYSYEALSVQRCRRMFRLHLWKYGYHCQVGQPLGYFHRGRGHLLDELRTQWLHRPLWRPVHLRWSFPGQMQIVSRVSQRSFLNAALLVQLR